jgi:hypothetical protein
LANYPLLRRETANILAPRVNPKGKNLATYEDIDKLVDLVEAVTTATKQIEARISNEVWDRQKRWEMIAINCRLIGGTTRTKPKKMPRMFVTLGRECLSILAFVRRVSSAELVPRQSTRVPHAS